MSTLGMGDGPTEKLGLQFDKTINLGHVLTIITLIAAFTGAYTAYQVTITNHEDRITRLENQTNNIWSIKQDVAVIKDRIERLSSGR